MASAVVRGQAGDTLLDSDEAERIPVADSYRNSPIAVGRRLRHAKVVAGDHVPHAVDAAVQKQLSAVCGV